MIDIIETANNKLNEFKELRWRFRSRIGKESYDKVQKAQYEWEEAENDLERFLERNR